MEINQTQPFIWNSETGKASLWWLSQNSGFCWEVMAERRPWGSLGAIVLCLICVPVALVGFALWKFIRLQSNVCTLLGVYFQIKAYFSEKNFHNKT